MTEELKTTRDGLGEALLELGQENSQVVVVNADLEESTRVHLFKKSFPKRFFQVGVAEQNMMGISAGLAIGGKIPFATSFAIFSPGLNWEQIRLAAVSKLNIKIASTHAGLSNAADGTTHQGLEDIALTRVIPNMTVIVPSDFNQAKEAVKQISKIDGPCYLRLSKTPTPILKTDQPFEVGKAQIIKKGQDLTIISTGNMIHQALEVSQQLENEGKSIGLINLHTIKPLDENAIRVAAQNSKFLVTIEEHQLAGGLFSTISEYLSHVNPTKIIGIGVEDRFGQTSKNIDQLYNEYGLSTEKIMEKIKQSLP